MSGINVNLFSLLVELGCDFDFGTHGSWVKYVTGLNREHKNGWSLEGDFAQDWHKEAEQKPGLYLIRSQSNNLDKTEKQAWTKKYILFELTPQGKVYLLQDYQSNGRAWAKKFWETIDSWFDQQADSVTRLAYLLQQRDYFQRELERVNEALAIMQVPEGLLDSDGQCRAVVLSRKS